MFSLNLFCNQRIAHNLKIFAAIDHFFARAVLGKIGPRLDSIWRDPDLMIGPVRRFIERLLRLHLGASNPKLLQLGHLGNIILAKIRREDDGVIRLPSTTDGISIIWVQFGRIHLDPRPLNIILGTLLLLNWSVVICCQD
jgi:hypothetical protein